jgi:hypothetical protein
MLRGRCPVNPDALRSRKVGGDTESAGHRCTLQPWTPDEIRSTSH